MAYLLGTPGNDTLIGTDQIDDIYGLAGNDSVAGLGGSDRIFGNQNNDTLDGGVDDDIVSGGKDNDSLSGDLGQDTLFGDLGNDTARGGEGDDLLYGDRFSDGIGDDFLFGEAGNDTLYGADGFDRIEGNVGNDYINGNQGNDTVSGGEGSDFINGGQDNDLMFGDAGEDTLSGDLGNDSVAGGEGRDLIFGIRGDDSLSGDAGDDEIYGNQGNDTVAGGEGNDVLYGGQNRDLIRGEAGNDLLSGDRGVDTLTGGEGNDTFLLRKNLGGTTLAEADIITDFANGADLLLLRDGLSFNDLNIFQGTGANATDTIIQDVLNNQFLAVLQGINRSNIDGADFVAPGTLAFSAPTFQVNEKETTAAVTVTRTDGTDGAVSMTVTPSNGTAFASQDYNNAPIVVNFAAGETSKTVAIPIVDDKLIESNETLNLTLSNPTGNATIGAQNTAILEIVNDDLPPVPSLTFRNPTTDANARFGFSVAAAGKDVLIGAPGENNGVGAAYLFDGTTGALLQTFRNPTPNAASGNLRDYGDIFGKMVVAVGNNVLISAPGDDTGATNSGTVYAFDRNTGALLRTIVNPNPTTGDYFGSVMTTDGSRVVIAAPAAYPTTRSAEAYLFDGITGQLLQTFLNPTPDTSFQFGNSAAIAGNNILIGLPYSSVQSSIYSGVAYLFDSATGALIKTISNPTPENFEFFGWSAAAVGNNFIIGSPGDFTALPPGSTNTLSGSGAAYLVDGSTGILGTLLSPLSSEYLSFGFQVAAVGNNVLIEESQSNNAYLLDTQGTLLQMFPNVTQGLGFDFGLLPMELASVGNRPLIGAPEAPGGGAVYLF